MVSNGTGFVALKADLGVFTEAARQHCRMTSASPSASAAFLRLGAAAIWSGRRNGVSCTPLLSEWLLALPRSAG
jgi:hypothetical protein